METFINCFDAYLRSITNIIFGLHQVCKGNEKAQRNADMIRLDDDSVNAYVQGTSHTCLPAKGKHMQGLTVNVSQLSTFFIIDDEKGILTPPKLNVIDTHAPGPHLFELCVCFCRWCSRTCA